jgi:hypothetical protein
LTQHLYKTHRFLKDRAPDKDAVCRSLIEIARAAGAVISSASKFDDRAASSLKGAMTSVEQDTSGLSSVIKACARAFTSILVGLQQIQSDDGEQRRAALVVFECVRFFKEVFESMGKAALVTAQARITSTSGASVKSSTPRAGPAKETSSTCLRMLAQFLIAIVSYLDKNDAYHREMFEGFLFLLLERVGKKLFFCCFGRNKCATTEGDIAFPAESRDAHASLRQEAEVLAVRLEVPALVSILERAIALAPNHLNLRPDTSSTSLRTSSRTSASIRHTRSVTSKALPAAAKVPLSTHAKKRLQRTMIQCMFDGAVNDEFVNVLRMPPHLGNLPSLPIVDEQETDEWFAAEVWRLLGADLLESQIAW